MAFFKDGFQKLVGAVKGEADGGYRGQLSSSTLQLCEGCRLGLDLTNPQTLTSWTLNGLPKQLANRKIGLDVVQNKWLGVVEMASLFY